MDANDNLQRDPDDGDGPMDAPESSCAWFWWVYVLAMIAGLLYAHWRDAELFGTLTTAPAAQQPDIVAATWDASGVSEDEE